MDTQADSSDLSNIFRFLAQSLRYPDKAWCNTDFCDLLFLFLAELGWEEELQDVKNLSTNMEEFVEELKTEHTRLFINAVPHVLAPPYASLYMDKVGQLYGPYAEQTRSFYQQMGYDVADTKELPDHITHELEFLAILVNELDENAEMFLQKYFRPWFPLFQKRVFESTNNSFYKTILKLIDFFTREDQEYVNESYAS